VDAAGRRIHLGPVPPPGVTLPVAPALADLDGDGDLDLFLACGGHGGRAPDRLLRNDGVEGGFVVWTDVSEAWGLDGIVRASFGGAFADYDRDGDLDLFVPAKTPDFEPDDPRNADVLLRNDGGTFVDVAEAAGVASMENSHQGAWLDADEDGWLDLYVPTFLGPNALYRNVGDGTFEPLPNDVVGYPVFAFGAVARDFDGDGSEDLLAEGRSLLLFPEEGDFDNPDGSTDPWFFESDHVLALGAGDGTFADVAVDAGLVVPDDPDSYFAAMGMQAGDLDGDGHIEVLFGNGSPAAGEVNRLGSVVPTDAGLRWIDRTAAIDRPAEQDGEDPPYNPYPYRTHGAAFADLDGDRDVDLWIGNGGMGSSEEQREPDRVFLNEAESTPSWLVVRLRGGPGNPDQIGAKLEIADGPPEARTWQVVRRVLPQSGFNSHQPTAPLIGLGDRTGPLHVSITWPEGARTEHPDVPIDADVSFDAP
jgi:hypothetical protein